MTDAGIPGQIQRIGRKSLLARREAFVGPADGCQIARAPVVNRRIVRAQVNRLRELPFGLGPAPRIETREAQRGPRLREALIQADRFQRRRLGRWLNRNVAY
jgi:hypothetical protein